MTYTRPPDPYDLDERVRALLSVGVRYDRGRWSRNGRTFKLDSDTVEDLAIAALRPMVMCVRVEYLSGWGLAFDKLAAHGEAALQVMSEAFSVVRAPLSRYAARGRRQLPPEPALPPLAPRKPAGPSRNFVRATPRKLASVSVEPPRKAAVPAVVEPPPIKRQSARRVTPAKRGPVATTDHLISIGVTVVIDPLNGEVRFERDGQRFANGLYPAGDELTDLGRGVAKALVELAAPYEAQSPHGLRYAVQNGKLQRHVHGVSEIGSQRFYVQI